MSQQEDVLCQQLGTLLDGTCTFENGSYSVKKPRQLHAMILGRPAKSAMTISYTFESFHHNGTCLCLAEYALLSEEVNTACQVLTRQNLQISAIHNHWLFDIPPIMYLHCQAIDYPISFASKLSGLSKLLR